MSHSPSYFAVIFWHGPLLVISKLNLAQLHGQNITMVIKKTKNEAPLRKPNVCLINRPSFLFPRTTPSPYTTVIIYKYDMFTIRINGEKLKCLWITAFTWFMICTRQV